MMDEESAELFTAILQQQADDRNFTTNAIIDSYEATIKDLVTTFAKLVNVIMEVCDGPYAPNPAYLLRHTYSAASLIGVYRDKIEDWSN